MGTRAVKHAWLAAPMAAALIAGCASVGAKPGRIDVTSEPPGAEVYVMGDMAGVTPLTLDQTRVFPLIYPSGKQALYGKVELRKAGCQPTVRAVSTRAVAEGIRVTLDCDEAPQPPARTPANDLVPGSATRVAPAMPSAPVHTPAVDQRLRQVRDLLDQGLITEHEAHEVRMRILNEL
jgi:hypothetical protein